MQTVYRYFQKLPFTFNQDKLEEALEQVLKIAPWPDNPKYKTQICLTRKKHIPTPDCYYEGNGGIYHLMINGKEEERQQDLDESDYSEFIHSFNHTYFKELYEIINGYCMATYKRKMGRVRLIKSVPRTSLSWHRDPEPRIHIPIVTDDGAMMIVEEEVLHMKVGEGWFADTENYHSQFNGSETDRIHLVATLCKETIQTQRDWTGGNDYY